MACFGTGSLKPSSSNGQRFGHGFRRRRTLPIPRDRIVGSPALRVCSERIPSSSGLASVWTAPGLQHAQMTGISLPYMIYFGMEGNRLKPSPSIFDQIAPQSTQYAYSRSDLHHSIRVQGVSGAGDSNTSSTAAQACRRISAASGRARTAPTKASGSSRKYASMGL